jgi:hypothetical protein
MDDAAPGGNTGVHVGGITGTVTTTGSLDGANFAVDVPLVLASGMQSSYSFDVFDNPAEGDVTGTPQFVGYVGDLLSGHRHTGPTRTFVAGQDNDSTGTVVFGLGGDGNNDTIGVAAGLRTSTVSGGPIFIDNVALTTTLTTQMSTFTRDGAPIQTPTSDDLFDIVVDIGPLGQRIQSGHIGVIGPANNTDNVDGLGVIDTGAGFISVMIDDTNAAGADVGGIDWRDRGNSSNGAADLVMLGEDFVKNNLGIIRLTLFGLPAGLYEMTSYHLDADFDQAEQINIMVNTGEGFVDTEAMASADFLIGGVNSLTTDNILGTSATFSFLANGADNVTILFDSSQSPDDEVPLNGFRLNFQGVQIPEPATATLGLMAIGALATRVRRRRAA